MNDTAILTGKDRNRDFAKIELTVTPLDECLDWYDDDTRKNLVKKGVVCAKNYNTVPGAKCTATTKGDSGGPVMKQYKEFIEDKNKFLDRWELIGLVSIGNVAQADDCHDKAYTLFTSIERFKDFIFNTMHPEEDQDRKGQFCDVHDQIECATCDEGFELEGKQCLRGYGSGPRSFLGTGTKFFDGNYCSERCPELMHCEIDTSPEVINVNGTTTTTNSTEPRFRVIYNPCPCEHGKPRKKCSGTGQACDPLKCDENYKHNAETDACEFYNPSEVSSKSVAMYLAGGCETTADAESVVGDEYCSRLYHSPFNSCDVPINEYYFTCVKELCLKGREERKKAICKELAKYEHICHSKLGDFDENWHATAKTLNSSIAFEEHRSTSGSSFQVTDRDGGYVSIDIKGSWFSLDVYGSMFHNNVVIGQRVVLGHYDHRTDQLWTMVEVDPRYNSAEEDRYYFKTKDKPQYALAHNKEDNRLTISQFEEGSENLIFKVTQKREIDTDLSSWRTENFCFKCPEKNYHRNKDGECVPNVCECAHGHPVDNKDCTLHGDQQCKKCKPSHVRTKYRHFDAVASFQEAKQICHDHNMVLAKIMTSEDSKEVQKLLLNVTASKLKNTDDLRYYKDQSYAFYLGAQAAEGFPGSHLNSFYWLNDEDELIHNDKLHLARGFTNWEPGQPRGYNRNCLIIEWRMKQNYRSSNAANKKGFKWHDTECHVEEKRWDYYMGDEGIGALCQHKNYHCLEHKYHGIPEYRKYHFYDNSYDNLDDANDFCHDKGQQIATFYNDEDVRTFTRNLQTSHKTHMNYWVGAKYYNDLEADKDVDTAEEVDPESVTYKDGFYCLGRDGNADMNYPLTPMDNLKTDNTTEGCLVYNNQSWNTTSCGEEDEGEGDDKPLTPFQVSCVSRKQYFFFPYVRTDWYGAVEYCKERGMQLPTFNTYEEFDAFETEKYKTPRSNYYPTWWLGIKKGNYKSRKKRWHYYYYRRYDGERYFYYVDQSGRTDRSVTSGYTAWRSPSYYQYYPFVYGYDCGYINGYNRYGYRGYYWTSRFYTTRCYYSRNVVCEKNGVN